MAFCANCGAQVTGSFCPNCGAPVAAAPGAGPGPASAFSTPPQVNASASGLTPNVASALCYLVGLVTGIIFLVIAPYNTNKMVRFHAFQSIFLHVGVIVLFIALAIVTHGLAFFITPLISLCCFILWLYLMYSAYNNKMVKLPIIGDLAAKQA